ncbi:hypothetical protein D3C81_1742740 [compost metagenome]
MGIAQDQYAPCIAKHGEGVCDGAGRRGRIFLVHIKLIVTCSERADIVSTKLIVTLGQQANKPTWRVDL